jgi:UDP-2,4-diacetamido-2,4,6-trideoxy-beta-L-altropyranose hydrolase
VSKPHVLIRADGSLQLGLGHISRCMSLARALQSLGATVTLVSADLGISFEPEATKANVQLVCIPPRFSSQGALGIHNPHALSQKGDAQAVVAYCQTMPPPDVIVVDHYALNDEWLEILRSNLTSALAKVDDLGDGCRYADYVINQNVLHVHSPYETRDSLPQKLLLGPRFALLSPEFWPSFDRPSESDETPNSPTIGISFGAIDKDNWCAIAVKACAEANVARFAEVATTSHNPNLASLRHLCQFSNTALSIDYRPISDFYRRHHIHVGAAGSSTWERFCLGRASILVQTADNQSAVIQTLKSTNASLVIDEGTADPGRQVAKAVMSLLHDPGFRLQLSQKGRELVDGKGALRVAAALVGNLVDVRRATLSDSDAVLAWRNHPATRGVSENSQLIDSVEHRAWFTRALSNTSRLLLIGQIGPRAFGVVRFDLMGKTLNVSIFLDPSVFGLNLGGTLLQRAEAYAAGVFPGPSELLATVLDVNTASQKLFSAAGYWQESGTQWKKLRNP